jgi:DNA-binding SARP family transcriptional activator
MIRLYGPLTIEGVGGGPLRRRAVRGLIAYLALRRRTAILDELAGALWPGHDPVRARARLHKEKWHAQRLLGPALQRHGDGYRLDPARVRLDLAEVERGMSPGGGRAPLERAVALSSGEPLLDVDYPFAEVERRRLRSIRLELLARVSRVRLEAGEPRRALEAADELIAIDALDEVGWRLAMEAEARLGARQAVLDRYGLLERELDRALGLRPQAETRAVLRRLLAQR